MKGKQRCKILKEIRQRIADANDIEYITSECQHKGDCLGTCPRCEAELRYLERELETRRRLGKTVVVAGLAAVIATTAVGCDDWFPRETGGDPLPPDGYEELDGDIALPPEVELNGVMPAPPEEELMGDPAWPEINYTGDYAAEDFVDMSADEFFVILTSGSVTRQGLQNGRGWSDLYLYEDENGNDVYASPIDGYMTLTVICDENDIIIDVQFHAPTDPTIVLPQDDLT